MRKVDWVQGNQNGPDACTAELVYSYPPVVRIVTELLYEKFLVNTE